jgi:hypothetical protein
MVVAVVDRLTKKSDQQLFLPFPHDRLESAHANNGSGASRPRGEAMKKLEGIVIAYCIIRDPPA